MKYRKLGRTGLEVSVYSFGGIVVMDHEQKRANEIVSRAVERGVNLFDVGPTYGNAEKILGPALEPYRKEVVLTCKTEPDQSKEEVREDIEKSLRRLKTDYFDVYQLHEVTDRETLNQALAPGGALEAIQEAQQEGLINYIGFSAHTQEIALELMKKFDFDTVMFPINWNYWFNEAQGQKVIAEARKTNKGLLAIKALAQRQWQENEDRKDYITWYKPVFDHNELSELAFRFTLTRDIDTAVSPGDVRMLNRGLDILEKYENNLELTDSEIEKLKKYVKTHGGQLYPIPH